MPLKDDWTAGESFTAADENAVAAQVNDNTANKVDDADFRLDDNRTPIDGSVTATKLDSTFNTSLTTLTGTQTLTNKTLTNPRLSADILDANGNILIKNSAWSAAAVNYLGVETSPTANNYISLNAVGGDADITFTVTPKGTAPFEIWAGAQAAARINANGSSGTVGLNLTTKNSGAVQANGVDLARIVAMALSADYTLTNSATAQKAFNATTNGAVTLPGDSSYLLEAEYIITNTGATSHTWAVLFAGTATLTALDFTARGRSGATSQATLAADSSASQSNAAGSLPTTALVMTAASTSTTENVLLSIRGTLRINAGGTFIPQIKLSAATGGTAVMRRGSYVKLTPIGAGAATSLGAWS